ncbi:MAG TPA: glycoside hydrolase family 140 protein, partial [Anaerolineae bacterium]
CWRDGGLGQAERAVMTPALPRIRVCDNKRFLVTEDGQPFFWLGDTAWELFHRLKREEAEVYFADRQAKRFTLIQAVALAEFNGLNTPNAYGELPLIDNNPACPNEAYFAYVDELIHLAELHGLYIGLLPAWGDKVCKLWGVGPQVLNEANARAYGRYLGERYRQQTNLVWILGGDRPAVHTSGDYRLIWRAMAAGIDEGTGGNALMTYHPTAGSESTSAWLHQEQWLDINMMQSGHGSGHDVPVWEWIARDYALLPTKPTLDAEPNYEDHPVNPWPKWDPALGYYRDHDVRKQIYRSVFAGACGVTYGHHALWQFYEPSRELINHADRTWLDALDRPGASQVQYLRALMESRPYLTRIPDPALLQTDAGLAGEHVEATRDAGGTYAFIYFPLARTMRVDLTRLCGERVNAVWYDPRTGQYLPIGVYTCQPALFTPPAEGPDWVLVLDSLNQ